MRHAHELQSQNERDFSAPTPKPTAARRAELNSEAGQLAALAASVPAGVEHAGKGLLDKDLIETLRRIEKLSKHIRSELNP